MIVGRVMFGEECKLPNLLTQRMNLVRERGEVHWCGAAWFVPLAGPCKPPPLAPESSAGPVSNWAGVEG